VLNNLAGNKWTENQSHTKIFELTVMTQKETFSKHKGTYNDIFSKDLQELYTKLEGCHSQTSNRESTNKGNFCGNKYHKTI
jgi:hypothetical protein